ncbi:MAG: glycosyltransferase [Calditrichaeota bacterium]|nr:MAG: glycosyltransferase [Calditrichota bacterium]
METLATYTLAVVALIYALQTAIILVGTYRLRYRRTRNLPTVSILVALRNEEATVKACVDSLLRQEYPQGRLEIILINDRSTDRTPELMEDLASVSSHIKTFHVKHAIPGLSGKANAIAQGIELATGELILVTDGDCRVPPNWARTHASYYTRDVGLVGGFTLLDQKRDRTSLFGKVQSLDWAYLLSVGTGAMGFGLPLSVLGNNFSFRRQAYEDVGGYRNIGFTIIEDFALMKTLLHSTKWSVLYPIDADMLVYSHPMRDLPSFYQQRKRWSAGGKEVGFYGKFLMFTAMVAHLLLLLSPLFAANWMLPSLASLVLSDFALLFRTTGLVRRRDLLKFFIFWEPFYFLYTLIFTPVLLFPTTVTWKGISYRWRFNWQLKRMFQKT